MRWRNPPFQKVTLSAQSVANTSAASVIRSLFKAGRCGGGGEAKPEVVETDRYTQRGKQTMPGSHSQ